MTGGELKSQKPICEHLNKYLPPLHREYKVFTFFDISIVHYSIPHKKLWLPIMSGRNRGAGDWYTIGIINDLLLSRVSSNSSNPSFFINQPMGIWDIYFSWLHPILVLVHLDRSKNSLVHLSHPLRSRAGMQITRWLVGQFEHTPT